LYGIGVGPGDPDLITLKAKNLLENIDAVCVPTSRAGKPSLAYTIARPHINPRAMVIELIFPMVSSQKTLKAAWEINSNAITDVVRRGHSAAFITLGDPTMYSTYGHVLGRVKEKLPDLSVETIPGIPSYLASAAALNLMLAQKKETVSIVPVDCSLEKHTVLLQYSDALVFVKPNRKTEPIRNLLKELGLLEKCTTVRHCGLKDEEVTQGFMDCDASEEGYLSLVILKK
jgi:precorrin-2/cobalt-factor-2 C20-methyltransferase